MNDGLIIMNNGRVYFKWADWVLPDGFFERDQVLLEVFHGESIFKCLFCISWFALI